MDPETLIYDAGVGGTSRAVRVWSLTPKQIGWGVNGVSGCYLLPEGGLAELIHTCCSGRPASHPIS